MTVHTLPTTPAIKVLIATPATSLAELAVKARAFRDLAIVDEAILGEGTLDAELAESLVADIERLAGADPLVVSPRRASTERDVTTAIPEDLSSGGHPKGNPALGDGVFTP